MYTRILVPTDGSEVTAKAVQTAVALAKALGAAIETITVSEPLPFSAVSEIQPMAPQDYLVLQQQLGQRRVREVVDACAAAGLACEATVVEAMHPYDAIIDHATAKGCDLIVMASHGRRGMTALLLGSETQKVLTHTRIAVLVVR